MMHIYYFRCMPISIEKVRKSRITKLGQGVEVRAYYPIDHKIQERQGQAIRLHPFIVFNDMEFFSKF